VGHRVVERGLLVYVTEDLNGTSYQCLHVDRTTLEPVTSGTAIMQVSPSGKSPCPTADIILILHDYWGEPERIHVQNTEQWHTHDCH